MATPRERSGEEAEIRTLIEERVRAVRAKDVNGATASYAPDAILFDVVNPLQHVGAKAARRRSEEWFATFDGPLGFEMSELKIAVGDEVAFCHGLNHVTGTTRDGGALDMWWRATACYSKLNGRWMVTHEHSSVPFDVTTGKASLNLKP